MPSNDDKLKALSEAIQRGLKESKELQDGGALEVRQMETNVRNNISAIGELLKVELSKKQLEPVEPVEVLVETPKEVTSDDSLKNKILELGSILHSALSTVKAKPAAKKAIQETQLVEVPIEEFVANPVKDFDEEQAQENIVNNFTKIANLLKSKLTQEQPAEPPKHVEQPKHIKQPTVQVLNSKETKSSTKTDIINNYVKILDKISKEPPTEAKKGEIDKEETSNEHELSPSVLKYVNEQVTALRIQIGHAMESGGGTVAQQFAAGGTMNGNLNVTGQILSGGVDLATLFTGGSGGGGTGNNSRVLKSSNFNAVKGAYYLVDTTSSTVTSTLPSSPAIGDSIFFEDAYNTWQIRNCILNNNSNMIQSLNQPLNCDLNGLNFALTYIGGSVGWRVE